VAEARRIFAEAGVADYATPEEAVRAFAMLATYRRNQDLLLEAPTASESGAPDIAAARAPIVAALAEGRGMLDELEAKAVLKAYGIPVVATCAVAADAGAASAAALFAVSCTPMREAVMGKRENSIATGCKPQPRPKPIARRLAACGMLRLTSAQRRSSNHRRFARYEKGASASVGALFIRAAELNATPRRPSPCQSR